MLNDLQRDIKLVVDCLIADRFKTEEEAHQSLKEKGIDEQLIPAYLVWIPMAFCRFMLKGKIQFPDCYRCFDPATGKIVNRKFYSENILFQEAFKYAEVAVSEGLEGDELISVAGLSAEFNAINQMELSGSKIENVVLSEADIIKTVFDDLQPQKKKRWFWQ